jgi:hypothetical protein
MSEKAEAISVSRTGFEKSEPKTRFIALFMAGTLVVLVGIITGLQWYVDEARQEEIFVKVLQPVSEDLQTLHSREDAELHSYRYTDRTSGAVRIPIERAMELMAAEYAKGKLSYPAKPVPVKQPAPVSATPEGGANAQASSN